MISNKFMNDIYNRIVLHVDSYYNGFVREKIITLKSGSQYTSSRVASKETVSNATRSDGLE